MILYLGEPSKGAMLRSPPLRGGGESVDAPFGRNEEGEVWCQLREREGEGTRLLLLLRRRRANEVTQPRASPLPVPIIHPRRPPTPQAKPKRIGKKKTGEKRKAFTAAAESPFPPPELGLLLLILLSLLLSSLAISIMPPPFPLSPFFYPLRRCKVFEWKGLVAHWLLFQSILFL